MSSNRSPIHPFGLLIQPDNRQRDVRQLDLSSLRDLFAQHQLLVLRGFNRFTDTDDFAAYCEQWGDIALWPFGKVLDLQEQDKPEDHIFDHRYVPLHWDGMYRPQIPEYQIFHCMKAPLPGQGGRTTFANTRLILQDAAPELRHWWSQVTGTYQRSMAFYQSKTSSPLITAHPYRDYEVIRYNEPPTSDETFINPPDLAFSGLKEEDLPSLHQSLTEMLYATNYHYAHTWQDGDILIADNFTLLHGREAFVSQSPRHLQRVHVLSDPPFANPGLEFCR